MAITIVPKFNLFHSGSGLTATKDDWYDIFSGTSYSPVASGKQLWLGITTVGADDKACTFELRVNTSGRSTGTVGNTTLVGKVTVETGASRDIDHDFGGNTVDLAPIAASTGVEKLWLRVTSGSAAVGGFYYVLHFTEV